MTHKTHDEGTPFHSFKDAATRTPVSPSVKDPGTIGSTDHFLTDHFRGTNTRVTQVGRADKGVKQYVVVKDGGSVGYFELAEGASLADAENAVNGAFDNTFIVV